MRALVLLVLVAVNALLFTVPTPNGLAVTFFDVGQGDSILIEGPTGVQVLIDGGPSTVVVRELGQRLPFWDKSLDAVIATHPDADHIGGLPEVLNRFAVGHIMEPGATSDTTAWSALVSATNAELESGAQHIVPHRSMRIALGGSAHAYVLYPTGDGNGVKDTNSASVIVRVVYGNTSFMLTGDAPAAVERELVAAYGSELQSTVLKAGHHGSKTSSSAEFIEAVAPQYVVFSRGCDNRYGHPAPEVVERFNNLKIPGYDTCRDGTITIRSDGARLRLPSSR